MYSVVGRVRNFKQPRGGYLSPTKFEKTILEDGIELNRTENIGANLVGMVVDYLARFMTGTPIKDAFSISLLGLYYAGYCTVSDYKQNTFEFGGDTVFEKLEWGHSFFIK